MFDEFLGVIARVINEDESGMMSGVGVTTRNQSTDSRMKVGDRVELVDGYEKYGDASGGPLQPGDRGTVVELQQGPSDER